MPKTIEIIIPEGTLIEQCKTFDSQGSTSKCDDESKTSYLNYGELQYQPKTKSALFKSPSFIECNDLRDGDCTAEFTLSEKTLNILKVDNQELANLISPSSSKVPVMPAQPGNPTVAPAKSNVPASPFPSSLLQSVPEFIYPFVLVGLPLFIVVIFHRQIGVFITELIDPPKRPQRNIKPNKNMPIPNSKSYQGMGTSTSSSDINILKAEIMSLTKELKANTNKLNGLEDDFIGINLRLQAIECKPSPPKINQIFPSLDTGLTSVIPATPPAALSVDLIKKAVASVDYTLISIHPHLFLSETLESQKGLEDLKCFSIDGDQSQASSKTQSEFIAISCNDETYLIPNIVPNAADPARTLKRHADKNNIYRSGNGVGFLTLDQLAVVQRNGDRFNLITPGQIA
jgi:hypothetical protein